MRAAIDWRRAPRARPDRRGFALPLAILAIAMLTAAVAAGFAATASETVVNNALRAQERAYQLAEAGMQQFVARRNELGFCSGCVVDPTASVDSEYTRVPLTGGYADVVVKRVWNPTTGTQAPLFFIRSRGVDTAARIGGSGGTVFAERTVGVYARWNVTTIQVQAVLTTFNGLSRTGNAVINGDDGCAGSALPDILQVMSIAQSGSYIPNLAGAEPVVDSTTHTVSSLNTAQAIDWNAVRNNAVTADVTVPPGSWPAAGGYANWPIIRVKTSAAGVLPNVNGQGLIIADSNFTIPEGADWRGVILVGGRLVSTNVSGSSSTNIYGAVVTGLNWLLPESGSPPMGVRTDNDSLATPSNMNLRYYACYVTDAGNKLRGYMPLSNTWMDNVAAW